MVADAEALEEETQPELLETTRNRGRFRGSFSGHERDHLYLNTDGPSERFYDAAYSFGLDFADDGRSVVPVDVDGDGDLDLAMLSLQGLRLLENRHPQRSFARVRLTATKSQRDALGAQVIVEAGGVTRRDWVKATEGFQSQVLLELHFGLADAERIDRLEVRWPSGDVEEWRDLPIAQRIALEQGNAVATVTDVPAWPAATRASIRPSAFPALEASLLEGGCAPLAGTSTRSTPVVVNFWSPSCAPCAIELPHLAGAARALEGDVRFVGVSVETEDLEAVRARLAEFEVGYPQALADAELLEAFFGPEGEAAALPATFVFDAKGSLRRVFRRPIQPAELESLLDSFTEGDAFLNAMLTRARALVQAKAFDKALRSLRYIVDADPSFSDAQHELGLLYVRGGDLVRAEAAFARTTQVDAENAGAFHDLALARLQLGRTAEAIFPLQETLRLIGDNYRVLLELGTTQAGVGDYEAAKSTLERAIQLEPRIALAHAYKGAVLIDLGEHAAARQTLKRALELDPTHAVAKEAFAKLPAE